jgi:hypothetical protein
MHCKAVGIRFLNRFATHPLELISRELGDFLTKLLLFQKTIVGNGCVRMRFQEAGEGLVQ